MEQNIFTRTAMISVLVDNDFHYMHLLSKGVDFDKSHNLTQDYYEKISDEVDYLMELALEVGAKIYNQSKAGEVVPDYQPEDKPEYDYDTVIECLKEKISVYVVALQQLRNSTERNDIQSRLDDMIRDWSKELNYRLARRSPVSSVNMFVDTGLDARVVNNINTLKEDI